MRRIRNKQPHVDTQGMRTHPTVLRSGAELCFLGASGDGFRGRDWGVNTRVPPQSFAHWVGGVGHYVSWPPGLSSGEQEEKLAPA